MSSLELVNFINQVRKQENSARNELRHDNFMAKITHVLGYEVALNFQGRYIAENGKSNPCYYLPKREAVLMVMSESYKVQAAVYDRMTEMEQQNNWLMPSNVTKAIEHKKSLLGEIEKCDTVIKSHIDDLQSLLDVGKVTKLTVHNTTDEQKEAILQIVRSRQSRDGQPVLIGLITNLASRRKIFSGHDYKKQVISTVNGLVSDGKLIEITKKNHTNLTTTKSYKIGE